MRIGYFDLMRQPLRTLTTPPLILAGRNRTYKLGPDTRMNMKELWGVFMEDFGKIEGQVGFSAYGVCHSINANMMDYMCAVEVKDAGQIPNYLFSLTIPARRTAVFLHEGDIAGLPATWAQIFDEWLPATKLQVAEGPQFEVYGEDENRIEIFIPVK